jgi:hypothetical protein
MRRITPTRICKYEAVEPYTIAIITGRFAGVLYKHMRQHSFIYFSHTELLFCRLE